MPLLPRVLCGRSSLRASVWNVLPQGSYVKARPSVAFRLADRGRWPCACRGTGGAHTCRTRYRRGLACSAGAACPPTPRRSLRSVVVRMVLYCRAVCCRAPGAGACSLPCAPVLALTPGSKTCCTAPGRDAAGCCGIFGFLPPSRASSILADQGHVKGEPIACNGEGAGAQP